MHIMNKLREHGFASPTQDAAAQAIIQPWKPKCSIGVVSPYDMVLDYELYRWAPRDCALYMTRTPYLDLPVTVEMVRSVSVPQDIEEVAKTIRVPQPDATLYACTSGSFCRGASAERELVQSVSRGSDAPAYTTSGAIIKALQALNITNIALVTPYTSDITDLLVSFLDEYGIHVVHSQSLELQGRIWEIQPDTALAAMESANTDDAEAIVVSCTNFPTFDIIAQAEGRFRKPVISANQASMWAVCGLIGERIQGSGQLAMAPFRTTVSSAITE
jgi:maleate isomerase